MGYSKIGYSLLRRNSPCRAVTGRVAACAVSNAVTNTDTAKRFLAAHFAWSIGCLFREIGHSLESICSSFEYVCRWIQEWEFHVHAQRVMVVEFGSRTVPRIRHL